MSYVYPTNTTQVSDSFADHVDRGSVNPGTDYVVAKGSNVYAIAAGVVKVADGDPDGSGGRTVCIFHDDGSSSDYLHLNALSVSVGQRVTQGQRIGFSGASGEGSNDYYGPHLHISFRPRNQISWFGNVGNADFDALMKGTTAAGLGSTPITTSHPSTPLEDDMPYILSSSAGQTLIADGRPFGIQGPAEVGQISGAPVVGVSSRLHNAILTELAKRDVPIAVVGVSGGDKTIYALIGGELIPLTATTTVQSMQNAGAQTIIISPAERDRLLSK